MADNKDLLAVLDCIALKIVIGSPIVSADFQNLTIPYVGTANPSLSDVEITDYEYSLDGGVTYTTMALSGSVTTGLTFGTSGTAHTLIWTARSDLGVQFYNTPLVIRLIGYSATQSLSTLPALKSFEVPRVVTQPNLTNNSPFSSDYKGTFGSDLLRYAPKSITR